ncbi:NACHT domain-containing protein [Streptomyces sp. NEAU-174]|uniref:NACHT domain-containing protein n=1 Tax=Streptomyces sp. NEAU-174 TaxID=3458254 RepID=UPI0040444751
MDSSIIGARLASAAVAPLVKKLFVAESPGAGIVDKPVRVSRIISFKGEKKTLREKDVRSIAEELVARAVNSSDAFDRLPDYEQHATVNALANSLRALGNLDMDDVQAVNLGYRALARRLKKNNESATVGLSRDAVTLYETVLDAACLHILHFFTQRSTFVARTLVEQSRQLEELSAKIDSLIARTPSPEYAIFEQRYADYVTVRHGELTIFGINLTDTPGKWPLSAAYLSLEATIESADAAPSFVPAEQVLAGRKRVLLRGVAGSGKTTLVQWLAVSSAGKSLDDSLLYLYGLVPLILPMRTLTRKGMSLPRPEDFLASVGCPIASAQPAGWIDRVLLEGRGLLLIDGIDEIPENEREGSRIWIRDLIAAYPKNRWLVTSRPSAVRDNWLTSLDFSEFELAPMRREDITSFIRRWHLAAGAGESYERALLRAIVTKQDLGRLATNPLMCALICALNRDRHGYLPEGRKELYEAALSMLLARRDRERGMHEPGLLHIAGSHQVQLLQKLAYWMIRNGRSEMDRADVIELLTRALPAMPNVADKGTPEEIYRHLLVRSGLLREPSIGAVDFVHRTFQDYLGAKAAVEALDFELLVSHAHLDQWEDVIRMAVAHARPDERTRILTNLLSRSDASPDYSHRLRLLAAACLEHATELDPVVRSAVQHSAADLIPPSSFEQAHVLADAGPVVLELLSEMQGLSGDEAYFTVMCAVRIGTDAAIPVLAQYRDLPDKRIQELLVRAWNEFDPNRFADEILDHLADSDVYVPVHNTHELKALERLGGRSHVRLAGVVPLEELAVSGIASRVTHMWIAANIGLSCDCLTSFSNLQVLTIGLMHSELDVSALRTLRSLSTIKYVAGVNLAGVDTLPDNVKFEALESRE